MNSIAQLHALQFPKQTIDVLLICALKDEYDQVLEVNDGLINPGWHQHPDSYGRLVADARFATKSGNPLTIRATHTSYMGREHVQALASKLINENPAKCIAMSGICAGRRGKVNLGDVIFAERLWSYDAGKMTVENGEQRFQGDVLPYRPSLVWVQRMQHFNITPDAEWLRLRPQLPFEYQEDWVLLKIFAGDSNPSQHPDCHKECPDWSDVLKRLWQKAWLEKPLVLTETGRRRAEELHLLHPNGLPAPAPFKTEVAPIASGAAVTEDAKLFDRLAEYMRKVLGIEMEASALGALGDINGIPVLVAKGVSDFGDPFKDDRYRQFAARASAECLIALLRDGAELLPEHLLSSQSPRINNYVLPPSGAGFVGRKNELSEFHNAWIDPGISIVTLVAPAGVGKTTLISNWLIELKNKGWEGAEAVYIWSSFKEGSGEDKGLEDIFFDEALEWFKEPYDKNLNITEKARKLANAILNKRTLLVLDGLEALQYPPGRHLGRLRATGISELLRHLTFIKDNSGLCVVTSREVIDELGQFQRSDNNPKGSVLKIDLPNLEPINGAILLHQLGVIKAGAASISPHDQELIAASQEVQGHALTLSLLARYLKRAENGDILCRDKINFVNADKEVNYDYAFKVVAAYESWFKNTNDTGLELDILRLFGFFDYPASKVNLGIFREKPVIKGLTDRIVGCKDMMWNIAVTNLIDIGLLWETEKKCLDTHRIVKEYFADQFKPQSRKDIAWKEGHNRLYFHSREQAPYQPDNLSDLIHLYRAVAHGCKAGKYKEAYEEIYLKRILRNETFFSTKHLGAISLDLLAVGNFFEDKWDKIVPELPIANIQGWLFNEAAFSLRALGRTDEALEPFWKAYNFALERKEWSKAAAVATNLSDIMLVMGRLKSRFDDGEGFIDYAEKGEGAIDHAEAAVIYARHTRNQNELRPRLIMRAYVCHQLGESSKAKGQFREIGLNLNKHKNLHPIELYLYWDYQLAIPELLAWRHFMASYGNIENELVSNENEAVNCELISIQARQIISQHKQKLDILGDALINLIVCRASLYCVLLDTLNPNNNETLNTIYQGLFEAVEKLKCSAQQDEIPRGLLPYAWISWIQGDKTKSNSILEEAISIANRGNMKLHIADALLFRARLFRNETDLIAAESYIEECEYGRRKQELMDAKMMISG